MHAKEIEKKTPLSAEEMDYALAIMDRLELLKDEAQFAPMRNPLKALNTALSDLKVKPVKGVVQSVLEQLKDKGFKDNDAETISTAVGFLSTLVDQYSEFSEDQHKKLTDPMEAVLKVPMPKPPPADLPATKADLAELGAKLEAHMEKTQGQYEELKARLDGLYPKGLEETQTTSSD